ncbi:MAG: hypothetical protein HN350_17300 [Phycisphaerales bacterium]|jgi:hypothetical protein|nr:hypothetical protein [Phycisphaerales bacterium]
MKYVSLMVCRINILLTFGVMFLLTPFATAKDAAAPGRFELIFPENNATVYASVYGDTPFLAWRESAGGSSGIAHYEIWLDGTNVDKIPADVHGDLPGESYGNYKPFRPFGPLASEKVYYYTPLVSKVSAGDHRWHVVAVDKDGGKRRSNSIFKFKAEAFGAAKVFVNHLGCLSGENSRVVVDGGVGASRFEVLDLGGKVVFTGDLKSGGDAFGNYLAGNFTGPKNSGTYRIKAGAEYSKWFPVGLEARVNYEVFLRKYRNAYRRKRCGDTTVNWGQKACHLEDARMDGGKRHGIVGGWHASSDVRKIMRILQPGLEGLVDMKRILNPAWDGDAYSILDEIKWGNKYIHKMQLPSGALVQHYYLWCGAKDWSESINRYTNNKLGDSDDRVLPADTLAIDMVSQSRFIKNQTAIYRLYKDTDPKYAAKCLQAAIKCYNYFRKTWPTVTDYETKFCARPYMETVTDLMPLAYGVRANLHMYLATDKPEYKTRAVALADEFMTLQETKYLADQKQVKGYFYRDAKKDKIFSSLMSHGGMDGAEGGVAVLADLCDALPKHPKRPEWKESLRSYLEDYLLVLSKKNAFGIVPAYLSRTNLAGGQTGAKMQRNVGGLYYQYLCDNRGANKVLARKAILLARGARILSNPKLRDAAWRQVGWILGNNPLNTSTVFGVGQGQPKLYKQQLAPRSDGMVVQGIGGGGKDKPYMRQGHWRWCEMELCHTAWFAQAIFELLAAPEPKADLETGFANPPAEAKPYVWWLWMNGNVTRKGITADLEAMAESSIGGAWIFNIGSSHGCGTPAGPVDYMSDEWLDLVKFSVSEAKRLGLQLGVENCAGWSTMGGPWIKPEHASQKLVSTVIKIDGGKRIVTKFPQPETNLKHYRDIAIFAYPTIKNEKFRVHQWQPKAVQRGGRQKRQPDLRPAPADAVIALKGIVNLSKHLKTDGTLTWDAPKGAWTILRLGHTPIGTQNFPAAKSGRGLEVDKLRREGVDAHWTHGIKPILDRLGPMAGKTFNNILIDSYEGGLNHWTPRMAQEFKKRRGYDPTPYLLTLTGRLVENAPTTDRFLWDFRRTVSELFTDNFYGHVADLCHKNGLKFSTEPYGSATEGLAIAAKADLPMGELWADGGYAHTLKLASSIAHINGRNLAGSETFTAKPKDGKWQNYPGKLKALGDLALAEGINRIVLLSFVHQPFSDDKLPGMTFGQWGAHIDRNVTWFKPGRAWTQYLARSQYLLQQGEFAADVLCFAGEASPNGGVAAKDIKSAGYDYDACGTDIFAKLKVDNGDIVLPSGRRYRLLVMPKTPFQAVHIAAKIRDLVAAGGAVLSEKPKHSPTLTGFPASENQMLAIADKVWGDCDGKTVKSNRYEKGIIFSGISAAEALTHLKVAPAVQLPEPLAWIHRRTDDTDIFFVSNQSGKPVHTIAGFLAAGKEPEFFDAEQGAIRPAAGWTVKGKHVRLPLNLAPEKSVFIVFRNPGKPAFDPYVRAEGPKSNHLYFEKSKTTRLCAWNNGTHILHRASGKTSKVEVTGLPKPLNLTGPWNVRFQPKRGAPEKARFDKLISWAEHTDPAIRYFSGTATSTIQFNPPKGFLKTNQQVWLDLGDLAVIAEVRLNNKKLGTLWHKPFKIEVSKALRPGSNTLEVDVTNLWINRLIGDEQHPSDCQYNEIDMDWYTDRSLVAWPDWLTRGKPRPVPARVTFTTWKHWKADDKLQPSGLIGPVTLRAAKLIVVSKD